MLRIVTAAQAYVLSERPAGAGSTGDHVLRRGFITNAAQCAKEGLGVRVTRAVRLRRVAPNLGRAAPALLLRPGTFAPGGLELQDLGLSIAAHAHLEQDLVPV